MTPSSKDWLVRTRKGEILGPFTTLELAQEIRKKTFTLEDEIAPTRGSWVSAQGLGGREGDEITRTSTRSEIAHEKTLDSDPRLTIDDIDSKPARELHSQTPVTIKTGGGSASLTLRNENGNDHNLDGAKIHSHKPSNLPKPSTYLVLSFLLVAGVLGIWLFLHRSPSVNQSKPSISNPLPVTLETTVKSPMAQEAFDLIQSGKTSEALKKLSSYHTNGPTKGDLEYLIPYAALLIQENESIPRAKKLLESILDNPASSPLLKAKAHHWLGYALLSSEEGDFGESQFLEALELNPKDPSTRFNMGRTYLKQEKYQQALDYFQLAELEAPDLWIIHIYKGRARYALSQPEEARKSFRIAIDKSPERWMGYVYYGLFLNGIKEHDEAKDVMRRMLTRDPGYEVNAPIPLGYFQERVDYNEYLQVFLRIASKGPIEFKEFGKQYLNYLSHGPAGPEVKRIEMMAEKIGPAKVIALKMALDRDAPVDELQRLVFRASAACDAFGYYGMVLKGQAKTKLGDLKGAESDLQQALMLEPKAAISHWALAMLFKKGNRESDAKAELQRLLSYHPNYIPAIVALTN